MTQQTVETKPPSTFDTVLEIGWLLIAIIVPLWVYFASQRPFDPQKIFLFRSLTWLLTSLVWARSLLVSPRQSLWRKPLAMPVLILAGVLVVTTLTAVNPQQSWWGSYERGQGSLTQLSYLLLFWLLASHLRTLNQAWRLLTAFVLTAVPLLLLGLAQTFGWQPLPLLTDARSPMFATLGRANFLAAYLVILLPLTLALGLQLRQRWQQIAIAVLWLAELVVIVLTLARTAWLAAVVAVGLFVLLWWGSTWKWRRWLKLGVGLTAVSGPVLILLNIAQEGSLAARLTIWQATLKLIGERPFLGHGLDSLELIFPGVYPPELVYYQGRDVFVDRAHNALLDWAVTMGVVGVLAHLLLWGGFFLLMHRALRQTADPQHRLLLVGILAAISGNLTNNLTSFDVTTTAAATWILMGVGMALSQPTLSTVSVISPSHLRLSLAGLVMLMGIGAIWWGNGRPFLADHAAYRANQQANIGNLDTAIIEAEKAIHLAPYESSYHHDLAWLYWQHGDYGRAESALLLARDLRPIDYGRWLALAEFYAAAAVELGMDTSTLAAAAYEQVAQLAPHHSQVYTAWGQFDWVMGERETAVSRWQQAVDLDATNGVAHAYLAQNYWLAGERGAATEALAQALKFEPQNKLALALQQQLLARP
jgi:O-antigen ligase/Tfp pilus assembly protein PilF